ncbi:hypothetical protein BSPA111_07250 [Buttiauxella sp. A111]|nr:hypothetical protein BSPA111_07250 [Buttiauxella sp. A111]
MKFDESKTIKNNIVAALLAGVFLCFFNQNERQRNTTINKIKITLEITFHLISSNETPLEEFTI